MGRSATLVTAFLLNLIHFAEKPTPEDALFVRASLRPCVAVEAVRWIDEEGGAHDSEAGRGSA
jgi:hypothetical protein